MVETASSPDCILITPTIRQELSFELKALRKKSNTKKTDPIVVGKKKSISTSIKNFRPKKRPSNGAIVMRADTAILKFPSLSGSDSSTVQRLLPRRDEELLSGDDFVSIMLSRVPAPPSSSSSSPPQPPPSFWALLPRQLS